MIFEKSYKLVQIEIIKIKATTDLQVVAFFDVIDYLWMEIKYFHLNRCLNVIGGISVEYRLFGV